MSYWRTSGAARLKAKRGRNFAGRAKQQATVATAASLMGASNHPDGAQCNGRRIRRRVVVGKTASTNSSLHRPSHQEGTLVGPAMVPRRPRRQSQPHHYPSSVPTARREGDPPFRNDRTDGGATTSHDEPSQHGPIFPQSQAPGAYHMDDKLQQQLPSGHSPSDTFLPSNYFPSSSQYPYHDYEEPPPAAQTFGSAGTRQHPPSSVAVVSSRETLSHAPLHYGRPSPSRGPLFGVRRHAASQAPTPAGNIRWEDRIQLPQSSAMQATAYLNGWEDNHVQLQPAHAGAMQPPTPLNTWEDHLHQLQQAGARQAPMLQDGGWDYQAQMQQTNLRQVPMPPLDGWDDHAHFQQYPMTSSSPFHAASGEQSHVPEHHQHQEQHFRLSPPAPPAPRKGLRLPPRRYKPTIPPDDVSGLTHDSAMSFPPPQAAALSPPFERTRLFQQDSASLEANNNHDPNNSFEVSFGRNETTSRDAWYEPGSREPPLDDGFSFDSRRWAQTNHQSLQTDPDVLLTRPSEFESVLNELPTGQNENNTGGIPMFQKRHSKAAREAREPEETTMEVQQNAGVQATASLEPSSLADPAADILVSEPPPRRADRRPRDKILFFIDGVEVDYSGRPI